MTLPHLCSQSDAETVAFELAAKLPDNICDLWVRFLTTLLSQSKSILIAQRLSGMIQVIQHMQHLPMNSTDARFPMSQDECTRLAVYPTTLIMESQIRLRGILYAIEVSGEPHPTILLWYLEAKRLRAMSFLFNE